MSKKSPRIIFWKRWEAEFQEPKTGTLKYALLNRKKTGFDKCVRIINKRVYLDVDSTFAFFEGCKEKIDERSPSLDRRRPKKKLMNKLKISFLRFLGKKK